MYKHTHKFAQEQLVVNEAMNFEDSGQDLEGGKVNLKSNN